MKQNILIFSIILFSIIGGSIGALIIQSLGSSSYTNTSSSGHISIKNIQELEDTIIQTVQEVSPSIVSIIVKKDLVIYRNDPFGFFQTPTGTISRQVGGGSGFFISKDGRILTNKHVVSDKNADYTVILSNGSEYDAKVLALDPINDLAVIKISDSTQEFSPITINSKLGNVFLGQFAIAVGNALAEFQNSISLGIISGKNRSIEAEGNKLTGLLQTDAAINPGNSGGPLLNLKGEVIGINTAIAGGAMGIGFAFALTQERIDYILQSIKDSGRIKRPFIGINYVPNSPGISERLNLSTSQGVYIIDEPGSIITGSSAEKSGIEPGDIILEIGDTTATTELLGETIQNSLPGDILKITLLKKSGEEVKIDLELGEY